MVTIIDLTTPSPSPSPSPSPRPPPQQPTLQQIHTLIDQTPICNLHRQILKLVSHIPPGRYLSFANVKDWIWEHSGICNPRSFHLACELSETTYGSPLELVPVHRVVVSNMGRTEYGAWVGDEAWRMRLLAEEGCRFDCNGRILGTGWLGRWEERRALEGVWTGR